MSGWETMIAAQQYLPWYAQPQTDLHLDYSLESFIPRTLFRVVLELPFYVPHPTFTEANANPLWGICP